MTDFIKFCFAATTQVFLTGFILAGVFVFIYGSAAEIPAFFRYAINCFEILTVIFGMSGLAALALVILRFFGRRIAEIAFRKLFA